jgi:hypothetical protein
MKAGGMTAAHRTLPFGTSVTVVNSQNGLAVVVRITDRGPFVHGRIIDLNPAAAQMIGISGLAPVSLTVGMPPLSFLAELGSWVSRLRHGVRAGGIILPWSTDARRRLA